MADNGEGGDEKPGTDIAQLRQQVLTFVARSLQGAAEKPIDEVVSRVLTKRRRKWRRRHNLPSEVGERPPDAALRSRKEELTEQYYERGEKLLACRRSGYSLARQLEGDKRRLQLQIAERYKQILVQVPPIPSEGGHRTAVEDTKEEDKTVLEDLRRAISQADALVKVKKMKLLMTPRLPPLHRRSVLDDTTTNEQFGMSLLVPAHQVMEQEAPPSPARKPSPVTNSERNRTFNPELSQLLRSPGNGAAADATQTQQQMTHTLTITTTSTTATSFSPARPAVSVAGETTLTPTRPTVSVPGDLKPAVELAPIMKDVTVDEEGETEELPRIACVMSLIEGQDTASVVEVTADNDVVIETNSSLVSEGSDVSHTPEPILDDRLTSSNILPEKEEIVSTMPEDFHEEVEIESVPLIPPVTTALDVNHNSLSPGPSLENHRDLNHHGHMSEEELVEMIMRDSELTAWIAKARLRPRTPVSYRVTRKRRSRSRSSSIYD